MAVHLKLPFTQCALLLFSYCVAAVVSDPSSRQVSHKTSQNPIPYVLLHPRYFPNERLYQAYLVIQRFKSTITADPKNITATWTGHDICGEKTYLGFYCSTSSGLAEKLAVTEVLLNGFHLGAPKLQGFIDELPDIALFHAASNNFGGDIPQLDRLPYLYQLSIANYDIQPLQPSGSSGDVVTGASAGYGRKPEIPRPCLKGYLNFTFHIKAGNATSGGLIPGIPNPKIPGFPWVTDAKALLLNYNNLFGQLPANLGFSKLSYLALANNKLTGPIPPSISHLQDSLFEVLLLNNQLSGCLPHELGMLHRATVIDAGMNQLTGPIPSSFSCLSSVEQLNLGGNRLYGQVPDALCKLASGPAGRLSNLTLSGNYFTSVGPACAALVRDGVLDVKHNCIPGLADQRRPAECAAFQSQPKSSCPAAATTQVACPATAAAAENNAAATGERKAREYSSYVTLSRKIGCYKAAVVPPQARGVAAGSSSSRGRSSQSSRSREVTPRTLGQSEDDDDEDRRPDVLSGSQLYDAPPFTQTQHDNDAGPSQSRPTRRRRRAPDASDVDAINRLDTNTRRPRRHPDQFTPSGR
ncbi:hypothetical protein BS78_K248300 [Paspalum vaginatum]|uniref:Leucine-rich repeat-containing N-terminal plant-type domain-containing protein n=1 Tax=Paspalum vaginatum TaxID=158149 RepID=A0A9W8CEP9_9POAL|nr:hypothetical protein BS78_K248300 [Paspalum vaginatum]